MVRQSIALIGATAKLGSSIAKKLAKDNRYRLLLLSEDEDQLAQISASLSQSTPGTEVDLINCLKDGCWEADIIMLYVPYSSAKETAGKIKEVATQKIVLAISTNEEIVSSPSALAQHWQQLLPNSKVVSAINNPGSIEIYLAGNDEEAIETIINITKAIGFKPIKTNSLSPLKTL